VFVVMNGRSDRKRPNSSVSQKGDSGQPPPSRARPRALGDDDGSARFSFSIEVRRMTERVAGALADSLPPGDPAAGWLRRRKEERLLVVMGRGVRVNFIPGRASASSMETLGDRADV
jgi:hypothetical protein